MVERVFTETDILQWRKEFPILGEYIHLANCSQSAQSLRVRAALETYLNNWRTDGMDWDYWVEEACRAKAEFARLIGADPDEIFLSSSVTEAVASIASSLPLDGPRKKIVTTAMEFPTVGHIWLAHQKYGYDLTFLPLEGENIPLESYSAGIDEDTLLVSATHVYYRNGYKQDLSALAKICHEKGALLLIDAYQGLGTEPVNVREQQIDILTSGCIKYLFGVPGIAFTYVRRDLIPQLRPALTGWFGQENPFSFEVDKLDYACDARRFDTGTPPVINAFAATAALSLANEIGVDRIAQRIDLLSKTALDTCDELGLTTVSPRDIRRKGGTTAIQVEGDTHVLEQKLKERHVIASARGNVIRFAPHFYTLPEELIEALHILRDLTE